MANQEQVERLLAGVAGWNRWRWENWGVMVDLLRVDLREADLQGADLQGADLREATLPDADLRRADLRQTVLSNADLRGVDLSGADLSRAFLIRTDLSTAVLRAVNLRAVDFRAVDLTNADLSGANLSGANLSGANLSGANLSGADFRDARAASTLFANVDLRPVQGLDTIIHRGRSTVGIDTLYKSHGEIPEVFLRGCGVPDSMIEYARALITAAHPIDYYSCFISYSSPDQALAERLHADLQAAGVRCWYAPEDMQTGDSIVDRLDHAIRFHDKLLIILSESAVASAWVGLEVKTALGREQREGRQVLFPIRIDDAVKDSASGWAASIRDTRHIGDFRQWQDYPAYQQAFTRLLRDLRAGP